MLDYSELASKGGRWPKKERWLRDTILPGQLDITAGLNRAFWRECDQERLLAEMNTAGQ